MTDDAMVVFELSDGERDELRRLDRRQSNPDLAAQAIVRQHLRRLRVKDQHRQWKKRQAEQRRRAA